LKRGLLYLKKKDSQQKKGEKGGTGRRLGGARIPWARLSLLLWCGGVVGEGGGVWMGQSGIGSTTNVGGEDHVVEKQTLKHRSPFATKFPKFSRPKGRKRHKKNDTGCPKRPRLKSIARGVFEHSVYRVQEKEIGCFERKNAEMFRQHVECGQWPTGLYFHSFRGPWEGKPNNGGKRGEYARSKKIWRRPRMRGGKTVLSRRVGGGEKKGLETGKIWGRAKEEVLP